MALSENEVFTFTWRIENFSMCPHQTYECIASPSFIVDFLENSEWQLRMYPQGINQNIFISCYLARTLNSAYSPCLTILYELKALSIHDGKNIKSKSTNNTFKPDSAFGYPDFCKREDIFKHENGFLPNDTLTLQCLIRRRAEEPKSKKDSEFVYADVWNLKDLSKKYQCLARTQIRVSSKRLLWPIKRIGQLPCDLKLLKCMPSVMSNEPSFDVLFYLKEEPESDKCVHIDICKKNANVEDVLVRCNIKITGTPKNIQYQRKEEYYFKGGKVDEVWKFPTFLKINVLSNFLILTDGTLYLQCDLSFSTKQDVLNFENISETFYFDSIVEKKTNAPTTFWERLYKDGQFPDVTLRVQDKEFKVHRNIFVARSDVFSRMFKSDMKEQKLGIVNIADLDPEIELLLRYMYTDVLGDLYTEDACKLYATADKYNVVPLKLSLHCTLIANLSVGTVCEILVLADTHKDEDLMDSIRNYINRNANEIFYSDSWKDFTANYVQLAASTMLHALTRKSEN